MLYPLSGLISGAEKLGIALDESKLTLFDEFTSMLLEWNRKFNLTRIADPEEIAIKHYLDSLSLLSLVKPDKGCRLIDVGTGAGLPGVALKIARPDIRITLLDSVNKKLIFLNEAIKTLGLYDIETVHARAEDAGRDRKYRECFDLVVSRAVAGMNVLSELCLPLCSVGGKFAAYKGPESEGEIQEAAGAIRTLGGGSADIRRLTLTDDMHRTISLVIKERPTPPAYPRKAGIPEKNPLI